MPVTGEMVRTQLRLAGRSAKVLARHPGVGRELPRLAATRGRSTMRLRLPWLPFRLIDELAAVIGPGSRVFEYGGGGSTLWFLDRGAEVVTVEHHEGWADQLEQAISSPAWTLLRRSTDDHYAAYVAAIDEQPDDSLDLVVVDGRERAACARATEGAAGRAPARRRHRPRALPRGRRRHRLAPTRRGRLRAGQADPGLHRGAHPSREATGDAEAGAGLGPDRLVRGRHAGDRCWLGDHGRRRPRLGPRDFASFAVLWALFFGIGGAFAGLQQEVTRSLGGRSDPRPHRLLPLVLVLTLPSALGVAGGATTPWWSGTSRRRRRCCRVRSRRAGLRSGCSPSQRVPRGARPIGWTWPWCWTGSATVAVTAVATAGGSASPAARGAVREPGLAAVPAVAPQAAGVRLGVSECVRAPLRVRHGCRRARSVAHCGLPGARRRDLRCRVGGRECRRGGRARPVPAAVILARQRLPGLRPGARCDLGT